MASTIQKIKAKLTGEDPEEMAAREDIQSAKRDVERSTAAASEKARQAKEKLTESGEQARRALDRAEGSLEHSKDVQSSSNRLGTATATSNTTGRVGEGGGIAGLFRGAAERSEDTYSRASGRIRDYDPTASVGDRYGRNVGEQTSDWLPDRVLDDSQLARLRGEPSVADKMRNTKDNVVYKMRDTKDNVADKLRDTKDTVADKMRDTKDAVNDKMRDARDTIRYDARVARDTVADTGSSIGESIKGAAHRVEDTLENVKEKIKDVTGIGAHHPNDVERQWGRYDSQAANANLYRNVPRQHEDRVLSEEGTRAAEFWNADKNTDTWDLWRRAKHHVHDVLHLKGLHHTELKPRDYDRVRSLQHDVAEVRRDYTSHLCGQHPNRLACESTVSKIIYNAYEEAQLLKKEHKIAKRLGVSDE